MEHVCGKGRPRGKSVQCLPSLPASPQALREASEPSTLVRVAASLTSLLRGVDAASRTHSRFFTVLCTCSLFRFFCSLTSNFMASGAQGDSRSLMALPTALAFAPGAVTPDTQQRASCQPVSGSGSASRRYAGSWEAKGSKSHRRRLPGPRLIRFPVAGRLAVQSATLKQLRKSTGAVGMCPRSTGAGGRPCGRHLKPARLPSPALTLSRPEAGGTGPCL